MSETVQTEQIRKRFSSISITKAVLVTFFALLPAGAILLIIGITDTFSKLRVEILVGLVLYMIPLLLILYAFRKVDLPLLPILKNTKTDRRELLLAIPLIVFSISVAWVTLLVLNLYDSGTAQGYLDYLNSVDFLVTTPETPFVDYLLIFIAVAVLAPLLEEIAFRGAMMERFGAKYSYKTAIILSSVIFGILHIDPAGAFMFGFVASLIYLKTRSLFVPVMIHLFNNGLIVIFIFFNDRFFQFNTWDEIGSYVSYGWLGILLFAGSAAWLGFYIKKNWYLIYSRKPFSLEDESNIVQNKSEGI
ncbi:MAG: CPBP family intramembrane metalloprotease [Balneolaceae bacterium]|nr:CPBP family intramembrane metalloprotease [Balneolaceae bacterium]